MRNLLILLIRIYQLTLSQILPHSCRFYPSCSEYAISALKEYSVIKGLFLSINRLLRCNPFFVGGFDPIPSKSEIRR